MLDVFKFKKGIAMLSYFLIIHFVLIFTLFLASTFTNQIKTEQTKAILVLNETNGLDKALKSLETKEFISDLKEINMKEVLNSSYEQLSVPQELRNLNTKQDPIFSLKIKNEILFNKWLNENSKYIKESHKSNKLGFLKEKDKSHFFILGFFLSMCFFLYELTKQFWDSSIRSELKKIKIKAHFGASFFQSYGKYFFGFEMLCLFSIFLSIAGFIFFIEGSLREFLFMYGGGYFILMYLIVHFILTQRALSLKLRNRYSDF